MGRSRTQFDRHGAFAEWEDGELVWVRPGKFDDEKSEGPQVIKDLEPYRSMIDGSVIDGRKRHRDHLRAHSCVEVGNDTSHIQNRPPQSGGQARKESLHRMLADVGDRDIRNIVQNELRNRR